VLAWRKHFLPHVLMIQKNAINEVFKEGGEVIIPDNIFLAYNKQTSMFTPKNMKFILKIK
jgi:hypothetical protein